MSGLADAYGYGTDPAGDAARRDAMGPRPLSPQEVLAFMARDRRAKAFPVRIPGHVLTYETTPGGSTIARCECGRWDGGWTGPGGRAAVVSDHTEHAAAERLAKRLAEPEPEPEPLRVASTREDRPRNLP